METVPTILRTIRESTGLRFTLIARVLPDRWVAMAVHDEINFGLKAGGELDVSTTLCQQVRETKKAVIIDHASTDPIYSTHATPKLFGFESYISVPIFLQDGEYWGTVCGLDPEPRSLKDGKTLATLELFGTLISMQLAAEARHDGRRAELIAEQESAKLREQFIAVLGHDVRNPLSSITSGTELLLHKLTDVGERRTLERIRRSSRRIEALVDDVLDLARGRLGGGITIAPAPVADLELRLRHVIAEVQSTHPEHHIAATFELQGSINCDPKRIEQLLSNLLANAVEHGVAHSPIQVLATANETAFKLQVVNHGPTISQATMAQLFKPYFRGASSAPREGLGLGLFIVSEITKSHGGTIEVTSTDAHTAFTLTMPRAGV